MVFTNTLARKTIAVSKFLWLAVSDWFYTWTSARSDLLGFTRAVARRHALVCILVWARTRLLGLKTTLARNVMLVFTLSMARRPATVFKVVVTRTRLSVFNGFWARTATLVFILAAARIRLSVFNGFLTRIIALCLNDCIAPNKKSGSVEGRFPGRLGGQQLSPMLDTPTL